MNTVAVQIPEQLLHEADEMIHCELFKSASDVVFAALSEFVLNKLTSMLHLALRILAL